MALELTGGFITGLLNHTEVVEGSEPFVRGMCADDPPEIYEQTMAMMRAPETGFALLTRSSRQPNVVPAFGTIELLIPSNSWHPCAPARVSDPRTGADRTGEPGAALPGSRGA